MCNFLNEFDHRKFTTYWKYGHENKEDTYENLEQIKVMEKIKNGFLKMANKSDGALERKNIHKKLEAFEKTSEEKMVTFTNLGVRKVCFCNHVWVLWKEFE